MNNEHKKQTCARIVR